MSDTNDIQPASAEEMRAFEEDMEFFFDQLFDGVRENRISPEVVRDFFPANVIARCENPQD